MKRILKWSGRQQLSQLIYILISILSGFFFSIWGSIHHLIPRCCRTYSLAKMSFSSKPKKVIPKGTMQELKLAQTINYHGSDTLKTEEVKTWDMASKQRHLQASRTTPPLLSSIQNCRTLMLTPLHLIWKGLMSPRKDRLWYFFFNHYKNCCLTV